MAISKQQPMREAEIAFINALDNGDFVERDELETIKQELESDVDSKIEKILPIETDEIADKAVTKAKIGDDVTFDVADGSITESKLADDAVTRQKLADNSVDHDNINDYAIWGEKILTQSITGDKIANDTISTNNIEDEAITSSKISKLAVNEDNLNLQSVSSIKLKDGAVTTAKIGNVAVTNAKIATNAVNTINITDKAVTKAKLGDDVSFEVADGSITTKKLAVDSVGYEQLDPDLKSFMNLLYTLPYIQFNYSPQSYTISANSTKTVTITFEYELPTTPSVFVDTQANVDSMIYSSVKSVTTKGFDVILKNDSNSEVSNITFDYLVLFENGIR